MEAKELKRPRVPRGAIAFGVVGLLLCAYALWGILNAPAFTQYVTLPDKDALNSRLDAWDEQLGALRGAVYGPSIYTVSHHTYMKGDESADVTLYGVSEGFFDAHPKYIIDGHLFDKECLSEGVRDIALDEKLSIKLFPGGAVLGRKVSLNDAQYRVVGIVKSDHTVGDWDEYAAYAPLLAVKSDNIPTTLLVTDAVTKSASEARTLEEASQAAIGNTGQLYDLSKESMRATMILRFLAIIFGFFFLLRLFAQVNHRLVKRVSYFFTALHTRYLRDMLKEIALDTGKFILFYAAIGLAGVGLLSLIIGPMYVFTEWVPDVIVEWSSVASRAGDLIVEYARPLTARTREMASMRFYALMLRWGVMALMSSALMWLWAAVAHRRAPSTDKGE